MKHVLKRILAFFIVIVLSSSMIVFSNEPDGFKIGDYIYFGLYNEQPILWRIINIDETGNPMLFLNDSVIRMPFDSTGTWHTNNTDGRTKSGSNLWRDSNIRQWLNSSEQSISWIQNPPDNSYEAQMKGFMSDGNFTQEQREVIKTETHKALLSYPDKDLKEGGTIYYEAPYYNEEGYFDLGNLHKDETLNNIVHGTYNSAYYHNVEDKVFLLDVKEFYDYIYLNRNALGTDFYLRGTQKFWLRTPRVTVYVTSTTYPDTPTDISRANGEYDGVNVLTVGSGSIARYLYPYQNGITHMKYVDYEYVEQPAFLSYVVRPAMVIDLSKIEIASGDGSAEIPYEIDCNPQKATVEISVADYETAKPLSGVNISFGTATEISDSSGKVIFEDVGFGEYDLSSNKSEYAEYKETLSVQSEEFSKTIYLQKGVAINSVKVALPSGGTRNLLTDSGFTVDKADDNDYTITADVDWNGKSGTAYVVGAKSGTRKPLNQQGRATVKLGQDFPKDEKFYIDVVAEDERYNSQRRLCVEVEDIAEQLRQGAAQYSLPKVFAPIIDIEILNSFGLQFNMEQLGKTVGVDVTDRKIILTLGGGGSKPESGNPFKGNLKGMNKFLGLNMTSSKKVDMEVFGRIEIPIDVLLEKREYRGVIGFSLGGPSFEAERKLVNIASMQKQFMVHAVPVVVKLSAGIGFEAEAGFAGTKTDFSDVSFVGSITPQGSIKVSGGVGLAKLANACLFGKGQIDATINFTKTGNSFDPTVTLSVGVELEVMNFTIEQTLVEGKFPSEKQFYMSNNDINASEFILAGRDYLNNRAEKIEENKNGMYSMSLSQENNEPFNEIVDYLAFPNTKSKPVILDDDTYLIYQVDDTDRIEANGLKLVFSKRDHMLWEEPEPIDDDGTADGAFDVKSSADTAFVAWENIKTAFPDDNINLTTLMSNSEITVSKFNNDGKKWGTPITLTNNEVADFSPVLAVSGEKAVVAWLSNSASDVFGITGTNNINYAFYENGAWQNTNVIANVGLVSAISVAYDGSTLMLCYDKDIDGSLLTNTDREVFLKNLSQNSYPVSISGGVHTAYSGQVFLQGGKFNVAYVNDEGLSIINNILDPTISFIADIEELEGYGIEVVQNGSHAGILWLETDNSGFNRLCGTYYDTDINSWTPKSMSKVNVGLETDIKNLNAIMKSDGSVIVSCLQAPKPQKVYNEDGTTEIDKGYVVLQAFAYTPGYNVQIIFDSIVYDEESYAKKLVTPITFDLEVSGEKCFSDNIQIMVYEGHPEYGGVLINDNDTISGTFNPGDVVHVETSYLPQTSSGRKEVYIKVVPTETVESNLWDNIQFLNMGYGLLSVNEVYFEKDKDTYLLNATIANKGALTTEGINVFVYEDSLGDNLIYSEKITELSAISTKQIKLPIPSDSIIFNDCVKRYYVEITLENEDGSAFIDVESMLGVIENPEYKPSYEVLITESKINTNNELDTSIIVSNNTRDNKEAKLVTALYDDQKRLIAIKSQDIVILAGLSISKQVNLKTDYNSNRCTQKVFLWDSVENIIPLASGVSKDVI
jgi:hypothetical protein